MHPTILTRPPLALVGLQIRTVSMSPEIPALWPRFVPRIAEIAGVAEPGVTYGWMRAAADDPAALLYLAAVPVASSADVPPAGMTATPVAAQRVAVFEVPFAQMGPTYDHAFRTWLPQSDWVQADGPLLERYGADFCPDDPASPVQIHVPVRARG